MESESSFSVNSQAFKMSAVTGLAAGIGSLALFMMLQSDHRHEETEVDDGKSTAALVAIEQEEADARENV